MSQGTVSLWALEDGSQRVIVRFPADSDGNERVLVYELGPIDWVATALHNPKSVQRMADMAEKLIEKLGTKPSGGDGGKAP